MSGKSEENGTHSDDRILKENTMRSEQYHTELIERYLLGKLNASEKADFEQRLEEDASLRYEVEVQHNLTKRIQRAALIGLIQNSHDKFQSSGNRWFGKSTYLWIGILTLLSSVALWFFFQYQGNTNTTDSIQSPEVVQPALPSPPQEEAQPIVTLKKREVPFQHYTFNAQEEIRIVDARSGAIIFIPANSLVDKNNQLAIGEVDIQYREFRDQVDIAFSDIPMTYKDNNFSTAGMFEIRGYQNGEELHMLPEKKIDIQFKMTKNEQGIGFYQLDDTLQEWRFLEKVPFIGMPTRTFDSTNAVSPFPITVPEEQDVEECNRLYSFQYKDTLQGFIRMLETHIVNERTPIKIDDTPFEERWESPNYYGTTHKDSITGELDPFFPINIASESDKRRSKIHVKIEDNSGEFNEVNLLKDYHMVVKKKRKEESNLLNGSYCDMRVYRRGRKKNTIHFSFKDTSQTISFPISLKPIEKVRRKKRKEMFTQLLASLIRAFEARGDAFNNSQSDMNNTVPNEDPKKTFVFAQLIFDDNTYCSLDYDHWRNVRSDPNYLKEMGQKARVMIDSIENMPLDSASKLVRTLINRRIENIREPATNWIDNQSGKIQFTTFEVPVDSVQLKKYLRLRSKQLLTTRSFQLSGFGIYNCDQLYRLKNKISLRASYEHNGVEVKDITSCKLIALNYASTFGIHPRYLSIDPTSKNAIMLFTSDGKIFMNQEYNFQQLKLKDKKSYTFQMIDLTDDINSPEDLRRILGLTEK